MRHSSGSYRAIVIDQQTLNQLLANFHRFPKRFGFKHFRIGLNAWGGIVKNKAAENVRVDSGTLKKSLSVKVVIPDASYNVAHHGKPAYVLVGPGRKKGRFLRVKNSGGYVGYAKAQRALTAERKRLAAGKIGKPLERELMAVSAARKQFPDAIFRNPSRYAHLVEAGHGGPRPAKAYPFIEPARRAGESEGVNALFNKLRDGFAETAAVLAIR